MAIYDPRGEDQGDIENIVFNIDITPVCQGISLADYTKNENPAKDRDHFLIVHLWDFEYIPLNEGVRTDQWKYFRYINDIFGILLS